MERKKAKFLEVKWIVNKAKSSLVKGHFEAWLSNKGSDSDDIHKRKSLESSNFICICHTQMMDLDNIFVNLRKFGSITWLLRPLIYGLNSKLLV